MTASRGVAAAAAAGFVAATVAMARAHPYSTSAGSVPGWPGLAVVGAALLVGAWAFGSPALAIAAVAWVGAEWEGAASLPDWARTAASAGRTIAVAALAVAALPRRRRAHGVGAVARVGAVAGAVAVASAGVTATLQVWFVDPFTRTDCWRSCARNPWLVAEAPAGLVRAALLVTAVTAVLAAVAGAAAAGRAARPAIFSSLAWLALTASAGAAMLWPGTATHLAVATGSVAVAAGALGRWWRARATRVALMRAVAALRSAPPPGALHHVLADTLADPALRVRYWAPSRGTWVDAEGVEAALAADGTPPTTIVHRGTPVAVLLHRPDLSATAVESALGPAARLWLANEQLRAAGLAELRELRESERRIRERTAHERRQLERNLHDGVQQQVVGIALLLRMLRAAPDLDRDERAAAARAAVVLDGLLDDLRRIAHGLDEWRPTATGQR